MRRSHSVRMREVKPAVGVLCGSDIESFSAETTGELAYAPPPPSIDAETRRIDSGRYRAPVRLAASP